MCIFLLHKSYTISENRLLWGLPLLPGKSGRVLMANKMRKTLIRQGDAAKRVVAFSIDYGPLFLTMGIPKISRAIFFFQICKINLFLD